jgi:hypothetical protein
MWLSKTMFDIRLKRETTMRILQGLIKFTVTALQTLQVQRIFI